MADDRDLDAILDEALAAYADAEPDPSLRVRITAVATAQPHPGNRRLAGLAIAAAACAALLLIAFLLHSSAPSPQPQMTSALPAQAPSSIASRTPQSGNPAPRRTAVSPRRKGRTAPPALARSSSFPSPSPLTAEESTLLRFAAEHPEQARRVLATTAADHGPLQTPSLQVAPIRIAALPPAQETQLWQ